MDVPLFKQFVLWRGEKRLVVGEEDLQTSKISSVFKVLPETLYLQDDFTRIARFPSEIVGGFDATFWNDKTTLQVMGEDIHDVHLPSPQQMGVNIPSPSSTQIQQRKAGNQMLVPVSKQKPAKEGFKRVVFLAHFEDQEIITTHTAHLRLRQHDCNVNDVAKLAKEYLNMDEDLVVVDSHGYEIMDNEATRGEDFWNVPARKVYAVTLSNYARKKKRQSEKEKGRMKRWKRDDGVNLHLLEEVSEKIDKLTEVSEVNSLLYRSIKESFKCCICMKVSRPINISGCCQRPIGCTSCVERWFEQEERCPLCKHDDGREKRFVLKGVEDFNVIISKLSEPE